MGEKDKVRKKDEGGKNKQPLFQGPVMLGCAS